MRCTRCCTRGGGRALRRPRCARQAPRYNDGSKSQKYICFARKQSRYMLGDKTGASYVVGFGPHYPQRPSDRGASCPAPPENCTTVNGLYNPAPNPRVLTGALVMVRAPARRARGRTVCPGACVTAGVAPCLVRHSLCRGANASSGQACM